MSRLEKPVGIVAWTPDVACQLVEACHLAGMSVPGDVAVVASDDDPMKTELTRPTVSAIELPAMGIGYEAAALLDQLMSGGKMPAQPILVPMTAAVTVRESSSAAAPEDQDVHRAVRLIAEKGAAGINVSDVAQGILVSRRWLERHFRRVLGRSPHEEIRRVRLESAKKLLLETDWTAVKVARASGFTSAPYFNAAFRREAGLTPGQYRKRFRVE